MESKELTDSEIVMLAKAALDHNAAIVQYCSFLFGVTGSMKSEHRKRCQSDITKAWDEYNKKVKEILKIDDAE